MALLWRRTLGQVDAETLVRTLEGMAFSSPFFPRPNEVQKTLVANKSGNRVKAAQAPRDDDRRLYEEGLRAEKAFYASLTEEQVKAAASDILVRNPVKAKSLAKLSLKHPGWRAMVVRMLRDGIYDTDEGEGDVDI